MTTTTLKFEINNTNRDVQFIGGERLFRVWITGMTGFGVKEIHDLNTCKGILHAFTDMALVNRYSTHMPGLHLRPTIEKLAGEIIMEEVGYVNNHYAGVIPVDGLDKLDDDNPLATTWGIVSFKNGRLYVTKKLWYVAGTKTESDEIKHWRHAIDLMNGFEIVMSGCSLNLWPKTKDRKSENTGEVTEGKVVIDRELTTALAVLSAPTKQDAVNMIGERVAKKQVRTTFARVDATVKKLADEGKHFESTLATVRIIKDRGTMEIEEMAVDAIKGLTGFLFKGKFALDSVPQDLSSPVVLETIRKNGLAVLLAQ